MLKYWLATVSSIIIVGTVAFSLVFSAPTTELLTHSMSLAGLFFSFLAFTVSSIAMVLTVQLTKPMVHICRKTEHRNVKFSYKSYVKYENNYYLVVCYNFENCSNNKTKIDDIYLLPLINTLLSLDKTYSVSAPYFITNCDKLKHLQNMENVKDNFILDEFDSKDIFFVFPISKVKRFRFIRLSIKVTGRKMKCYKFIFINASKLIESKT